MHTSYTFLIGMAMGYLKPAGIKYFKWMDMRAYEFIKRCKPTTDRTAMQ